MRSFIDRLFLQSVTRPDAPEDDDLYRWLDQVQDSDYALLALRELLSRHLLNNAATAGSMNLDDTTKLRACERMEFARMFLLEFELKREEAHAWRRRKEQEAARQR